MGLIVCLSFFPFHKKPPFKCVCYFTSILDPFSYTLCAKNHIVFSPFPFFNLIFWFGQLFIADFASFFVHRHKKYFIFRKEHLHYNHTNSEDSTLPSCLVSSLKRSSKISTSSPQSLYLSVLLCQEEAENKY